ncbi:TPA: hypothetical protein DCL30_01010 [Candidatus Peribacteria bacterium]|nr:MAG: hypothetical protein A3J91_02900 [Candidatus Peribacteria bacterium RIFOXYC2_FULL_58_10]OGJ85156.1 MAG: hypothetical protein A2529_01685 [Candidatus Peribacteria bacterium RIFOXYD2_FULL_58_15]HAI98107.1 hypothetical protein [Candidatus Peribacteria bacterium]HAS33852.1 hypothetical protein [Candidatus Peribacteria bacterium]
MTNELVRYRSESPPPPPLPAKLSPIELTITAPRDLTSFEQETLGGTFFIGIFHGVNGEPRVTRLDYVQRQGIYVLLTGVPQDQARKVIDAIVANVRQWAEKHDMCGEDFQELPAAGALTHEICH